MENSVVDMRNEIDFELVTDPSLIVVQNIATGENNLTVFSLKEIRLGYFWEDQWITHPSVTINWRP